MAHPRADNEDMNHTETLTLTAALTYEDRAHTL